MAGQNSVTDRYGFHTHSLVGIAFVIDQRPGAVEGGGAEIVRFPAHYVAGRVADPAADTFDARISRLPFGTCRFDVGELEIFWAGALEDAAGAGAADWPAGTGTAAGSTATWGAAPRRLSSSSRCAATSF